MDKKIKSTKKVKPEFVVDLTNAETAGDVYCEFAMAKVAAGKPISVTELNAVIVTSSLATYNSIMRDMLSTMDSTTIIEDDELAKDILKLISEKSTKKELWYKKFWRWLTRKKKK